MMASSIIYNIPFPYEQFTDTKFILTDQGSGLFIPDDCYIRQNETQIKFSSNNTIGISQGKEIKFTFIHAKNKRWIGKVEYHLTVDVTGQKQFNLPSSPYNKLVNIKKRIYVFYNRVRQTNGLHYYIDNEQGQIIFVNKSLRSIVGDRVDIVIIYSQSINNGVIQEIPQSGYIALSKYEIDRNYNTNLMAVFINGKLIDKNDILQMTNTLYKINTDIYSRYNLEVKNLSPKISSLIPYYKQHCNISQKEETKITHTISCRINVAYIPKGRQTIPSQFSPMYFFPDLIDNPNLWINFILRRSNTNYTLKLFGNDETETPSNVNVVMQLRIRTYRDFIKNSESSSIVYVIPSQVTSVSTDQVLFSIQLRTIIEMDTMRDYYFKESAQEFITYLENQNLLSQVSPENVLDLEKDSLQIIVKKIKNIKKQFGLTVYNEGAVDGVIGKLQANMAGFKETDPIYYSLISDGFDYSNKVNVFRWTISTKTSNTGTILWDKDITLEPDNQMDLLGGR